MQIRTINCGQILLFQQQTVHLPLTQEAFLKPLLTSLGRSPTHILCGHWLCLSEIFIKEALTEHLLNSVNYSSLPLLYPENLPLSQQLLQSFLPVNLATIYLVSGIDGVGWVKGESLCTHQV